MVISKRQEIIHFGKVVKKEKIFIQRMWVLELWGWVLYRCLLGLICLCIWPSLSFWPSTFLFYELLKIPASCITIHSHKWEIYVCVCVDIHTFMHIYRHIFWTVYHRVVVLGTMLLGQLFSGSLRHKYWTNSRILMLLYKSKREILCLLTIIQKFSFFYFSFIFLLLPFIMFYKSNVLWYIEKNIFFVHKQLEKDWTCSFLPSVVFLRPLSNTWEKRSFSFYKPFQPRKNLNSMSPEVCGQVHR